MKNGGWIITWSKTEPETDDEVLKVSLLLYISMYRLNSNPRTPPTEKGAGRQVEGIGFEAREG